VGACGLAGVVWLVAGGEVVCGLADRGGLRLNGVALCGLALVDRVAQIVGEAAERLAGGEDRLRRVGRNRELGEGVSADLGVQHWGLLRGAG
jgi:hypothetical protein